MSQGDTMSSGETAQLPASATPKTKKVIQFTYPMLGIVVAIVLLVGLTGGLLGQVILPPKNGHNGARGVAGPAGPQGQVGPPGSAANVDWSTHGLCFNTGTSTYQFGDNTIPPLLTSAYAYLETPTITNGTQTCPSGTFVPLENPPSVPSNGA